MNQASGKSELLKESEPLVTCLLPTYNKFANSLYPDSTHLIEESIESFLRQTYERKEAILVNDCPGQTYECSAPGVTVINLPRRFRSLGEKLNFIVGVAKGDLLFRWDDDDLYFPWRISTQVEALREYGYVTSSNAWVFDRGQYFYTERRGAQVAFRRKLFSDMRGFTFMGIGEDSDLEKRIRAAKPNEFVILPVDRESCYTLLRWDSRWEHICLRGYAKMGTTPTSPGHKVLVPHWRVDYVQEVLQRGIMPGMEEPPAARGMVWPAEKVK